MKHFHPLKQHTPLPSGNIPIRFRKKNAAVFLSLALCFLSHINMAQPGFTWAKQMGGINSDYGLCIAVDISGNSYVTGSFSGTADFDPGPGIYYLASAGVYDIFVSKLDASGNLVWAKRMGGSLGDYGFSIGVDASGNVFTTGFFQDTADFDPGPAIHQLISKGDKDIFVSKLDASGNFVWAKQFGGTGYDAAYSSALDGSGNIYIAGVFNGNADFDPDNGGHHLSSAGAEDIFVSKLGSSGNLMWAKKMGGVNNDVCNFITVDGSGNVYATGHFRGIADFDPGPAVYNLQTPGLDDDIFISKLNSSGNFVWAKRMGGGSNEMGNGLALDAAGDILITGGFNGTADFDPGPGIYNLTSNGGMYDIFISKLNAAGNFMWAKSMGGRGYDIGNSITTDAGGNVYSTGFFQDTVNFDPAGSYNLFTAAGSYDLFISELSSSGNFICAGQVSGRGNSYGKSIALHSNLIYTTGYFNDTTDFDPGPGAYNLFADSADIFVAKMSNCPSVGTGNISNEFSIAIFPNPSGGKFSISLAGAPGSAGIKIYNMLGEQVFSVKSFHNGNNEFDLSGQPKGIYFVQVIPPEEGAKSKDIIKKIIIQ